MAKSYEEIEGVYYHKEIYQGLSGPSNLYTSIEDMAIWYSYFSPSQNSTLAKSVQRLDEPALTDTGIPDISFWGEMKVGQYFRHAERGLPKDWQFGLSFHLYSN